MPLGSRGREYLVVVVCLAVLLLVVKFQREVYSEGVSTFSKQYSHSGKALPAAITNVTLGVRNSFHLPIRISNQVLTI